MKDRQKLDLILNQPKRLSEAQKRAVLSDSKHIRVVAGAGAGKTETLTRKIVYKLICEELDPSSIVAFTFTEKAAQSMKSRVYDRLRGLGREDICYRLGDLYIGTIHGYCYRILADYFGYGSYEVFDANKEMAFLLSRAGWELGLGNDSKYAEKCREFIETVNVVNGELINERLLEKSAPLFYKQYKKYEDILDSYKRLTFDRMVKLAVIELENNPDKLKHVKYLLVDEYQDINRAQEKLIQLIGANGGIFIVGDPRQTIYKWRGSDEMCFEEFSRKYQDTETISITENRRSAKSILKLANTFSDSFETQKYDHLLPVRKDDGIVARIVASDAKEEAHWIADQIEKYVKDRICDYSDIGILIRSVANSAPPFIDEFRKRGIPFIVGGKVGLFRREEAKAVGMLFCWLYEDGKWQLDRWDSTTVIRWENLLPESIKTWQSVVPYKLPDDVEDQLKYWREKTLSGEFKHFTEVYQNLLRILGYLNLDPEDPNQAVIMANLGRFNSLITDYETAIMLGGKNRNWEQDVKGLFWYIRNYATSAYEEQQGDDVRSINAVQIVTIHQAKGLEWPVVFMPALIQTRFPSKKVGTQKKWHIPRSIFNAEKYEGSIEDERRLFYVAVTRAKDILVLSSFKRINRSVEESEFFNSLPSYLYKKLSVRDILPRYILKKVEDIEDIQTFSAGEIIYYKRCPYSYRLREIWGYQPGLSEFLGYGNTLHFCLRVAAECIKNHGDSPVDAIERSVEEHFFMPFASKEKIKNIKENAKRKLIEFCRLHEDDMRRIKEVETRVEFPLQRATIVGKVDVILHDGDSIEIRDYKTSDQATTFEESAMQVRLYAIGLNAIGENVSKGSIAYLDDASIRDVSVERDQVEEAERLAEKFISGIINRNFDPCRGDHCNSCDYACICRWMRAKA